MLAASRACGSGRGLVLRLALLQCRPNDQLPPRRLLALRLFTTTAPNADFDVLSSAPPPAALPTARSTERVHRRSTIQNHTIVDLSDIDACATREEVLTLFARQRRNAIAPISELHIGKLFAVLKARAWSDSAGENRHVANENLVDLLAFTRSRFSAPLGARTLATVLQACCKFAAPFVSPEWLVDFWRTSRLVLPNASIQSMTLMLYSAGKFRATPPPAEWFDAFFAASGAAIARGQFNGSDCANSLFALALLNAAPPASWLDPFWSMSGPVLGRCKAQEHASVMHACGQLRLAPTAEWMNYYWAASRASLRLLNARSLCTVLAALERLGARPPTEWYEELFAAISAIQSQFTASEIADVKNACAQLGLALPEHRIPAKGEVLIFSPPTFVGPSSRAPLVVPHGRLSHADHVSSLMQSYVREQYADFSETSPNGKP